MKNTIWMAALVCLMAACKNDKTAKPGSDTELASGELTLKGEIEGQENGLFEILYMEGDSSKVDTVKLQSGKFNYQLQLTEPRQMALRSAGAQGQELVFFADPGTVTLKAHRDSIRAGKVNGGPSQKVYSEAEQGIRAIMARGGSFEVAYRKAQAENNMMEMQLIQQQFMLLQDSAEHFAVSFAKKNNNSVVSALLGLMYLGNEGKETELKQLYDTLTVAVRSSFFGKKMEEIVKSAVTLNMGSSAPNFTLPDVNDKPVSLASYKGKYVLVDFWASWCGPCRQENPNVVLAYQTYKDKGFEVLGVSLDDNKAKWLKGISDDKLAWTQVSDLKNWQSDVARLYGIKAIPANFLLDKEGKIIGKNLRGQELQDRLKDLLN